MPEKTFRLYDTLSRTVKPLELLEPGHLRFYSCGPTVYSYAHIGNFRSFLTADLVVRTAKALGWKVTWVSNITDVGHLTQDDIADATGEDKMERALRSKEGEQFHNVWELAEYYADAYRQDWKTLNLLEPDIRPKATQHVREQILAAQELIARGHAYETPTGVYFAVETFDEYGKLSGNRDQESLKRAVRDVVADENKRHPADFAIWKKDEGHLMQWYSPFGWGFPGWHIECSVMARAYLGDTLDLHSGGEDNIFPHHECEIAQSESLTGKPLSNHWLHTRFLQVNGEKMAKSAGNFYTVRDLVHEKGADPLALRYALIAGVYGKPLNFTLQSLKDATGNVDRFRQAYDSVRALEGEGHPELAQALDDLYDQALDAMCNDLNTSVALAKTIEGSRLILRDPAQAASSGRRFLERMNELLGVVCSHYENGRTRVEPSGPVVDEARIEGLIAERADAKKAKDFARADAIRAQLDAEGIELQDTPAGTVWKVRAAF
ncbi:MAG TPA: cysteine--tRNA ligase [Fimbriimonadaceae bacterium]|nr:cysteine--tRNA ligase [Fimbriimonadaceae bacterium]